MLVKLLIQDPSTGAMTMSAGWYLKLGQRIVSLGTPERRVAEDRARPLLRLVRLIFREEDSPQAEPCV